MTINSKIKDSLQAFGIPYKDGLAYLLSVYYQTIPSYIPHNLVQRINATGILGIENSSTVFIIPLFENTSPELENKWLWVEEFRNLFKQINPERAGNLKSCIARMKTFFANNPDVRTVEVLGATRLYISNVREYQYLKTSHKFISEGTGNKTTSALEEWVERYRLLHQQPETEQEVDIRNKMQY